MVEITLKLIRFIGQHFRWYPDNKKVAVIRKILLSTRRAPLNNGRPMVVAFQLVEDPVYLGVFGILIQELKALRPVRAELVVIRAINGAIGVDWIAKIFRSVLMCWIDSAPWIRVYKCIADVIGYRSQTYSHPIGDLTDALLSLVIWSRLRRQNREFELTIRGVQVDDLIIDSYLRFHPSPRFDRNDAFVWRLIWQAHRNVRRSQAYFVKNKPDLYITSYASYLEHGIPVRAALQAGVPVYSFGNFFKFGKELTLADWFHTHNCEDYLKIFDSLQGKEIRLNEAEYHLKTRLSGGIDPATNYMRVSAYAGGVEAVPTSVYESVVIFLHDFYDSPHVYPGMIFTDFWEWVCFTIEALQRTGVKFFVKPHPNQISLSCEALKDLKILYPTVEFIPQSITNVQLANAGIICGITVHGTVSHELAYLGIPSITCDRHPHIAFDFCRTAKNKAEYENFLRNPKLALISKAEMKQQALKFFYVHNLYGPYLNLRASVSAFWQTCLKEDVADQDLIRDFVDLREQADMKHLAKTIGEY